MRTKIAELRKQRVELVAQSRALLDRAEKEKRELTAEEQSQWDKMQAEIDSLAQRIERIERMLELESEIVDDSLSGEAEFNQDEDEEDEEEEERSRRRRDMRSIVPEERARMDARTQERREAFWSLMRGDRLSRAEARALGLVPDSAGGYTVPDEFVRQLVQKLEEENVMR